MICKNCGKELLLNEKFCTQCGQKQEGEDKEVLLKEKTEGNESTVIAREAVPPVTAVEKNDFVENVISKLTRFVKSVLPGKKDGISAKEQKKNRIIAACLIAVFLFLQGSDTVKSYDNESGAVLNMSLNEFCEAFDEAYENIDKPSRYGESPVNLESLLEDEGEEVDSTGAEYESYYAKIENDETGSVAYIEFMVYDGNIGLVSVAFYSIDIEFPIIVTLAVIEACSGVGESKAESVFETVVEDSVTIRMDDISYYVSKAGHFVIRPVSNSYVRAWETKGVTVLEW